MADPNQAERLRRNIEEWNQWRREHPEIRPDLNGADLSGYNLRGADLSKASLIGADFTWTILEEADLSSTDLIGTHLTRTSLARADLSNAHLFGSYGPTGRYLTGAFLIETNLTETDFTGAHFYCTTFVRVDLSSTRGLESAVHDGPSTVDINSVILPHDEYTRCHFLHGVGWTSTQIDYLPSLLTPRPIQYHSLFISYAHQDERVAKQLYSDLRKMDVPCWFAPHDLCPGTPILRGIEEAIHVQRKFLLILSKYAVNSAWIEREVDAALHLEIKRGQDVLFPIRLDNAVLESSAGWATRLQHRHIGDFTGWQDEATYQEAFTTLLRHLKVSRLPQV